MYKKEQVYGANRRWQCDVVGIPFDKRRQRKGIKKSILFLYKVFPLTPPLSLLHTIIFLFKPYKKISFYPLLPFRKNSKVILENYDSLFDYNSIKRFFYEPIIQILLFFAKGKYIFYSETSKKSFRKTIFSKYIYIRSEIGDFFKIPPFYKPKIYDKKLKIICFAGDYFLKGGKELCYVVNKLPEIYRTYKLVLFLPVYQREIVERDLNINYPNIKYEIKIFNEEKPKLFYEYLAKSKYFILPTFYDSHAIVVKEAKQCECITITTDMFDCGTNADIVLPPHKKLFNNYKLRFPLIGELIIKKYSNPNRRISFKLVNDLKYAIMEGESIET